MKAAWLVLALLAVQPAPITIADCLLASGYSRAVPRTPITTLAGVDAWASEGERALIGGEQIGYAFLDDSDGARRSMAFYAWSGRVYVFVFKHPSDPGRRLPGEAETVQHGDCFLRLGPPTP